MEVHADVSGCGGDEFAVAAGREGGFAAAGDGCGDGGASDRGCGEVVGVSGGVCESCILWDLSFEDCGWTAGVWGWQGESADVGFGALCQGGVYTMWVVDSPGSAKEETGAGDVCGTSSIGHAIAEGVRGEAFLEREAGLFRGDCGCFHTCTRGFKVGEGLTRTGPGWHIEDIKVFCTWKASRPPCAVK